MQVHIAGRHLQISDEAREFIEERADRFLRYFDRIGNVQVTLSPEKDIIRVELVVHVIRGLTLVAADQAEDVYVAVDRSAEKIERKLVKLKEKIKEHRAKKAPSSPKPGEQEAEIDYEDILDDLREELK